MFSWQHLTAYATVGGTDASVLERACMKPTDDHVGVALSDDWRAEFDRQLSEELLNRLKGFAARRLAGYGGARKVDMDRAEELAVSSASDTACGRVAWNPERRSLEQHLQNVIGRRLWLDWKHAQKFRPESIEASADDDRSTTLDDMEHALAERFPDAESTAKAAEALDELERRARADPELAAYIDARTEGLTGADLQQATGLSPEGIRRVRRRLDEIAKQLSYQVRPGRGKRGK
jgi:hypothetical protein